MRVLILCLSTLYFSVGLPLAGVAQDRDKEEVLLKDTKQGITKKVAPELKVEKWIQLPEGKKTISIKDYDKKILIMFFFQSWCKGCHKNGFPVLKKLVDHYKGNDKVQFLAIQTTFEGLTTNTPDKLEPTAKQFELTHIPFGHYTKTASFPGIMGPYNEKAEGKGGYNSGGTPWFVVVGPDRIVEYNGFRLDADMAIKSIDKILGK